MQRNINRKWILKRCLSPQARAGGGLRAGGVGFRVCSLFPERGARGRPRSPPCSPARTPAPRSLSSVTPPRPEGGNPSWTGQELPPVQRLSSALLSASPGGDVPVSLRRAVRVSGTAATCHGPGAAGPAVLARGSHSGRSAGVVGRSLGGGAVTDAPQVAGVLGPCSISGAPRLRGPLGDLGVLHAPAACGGRSWPPPQRPLAGTGSSGRCAPPGLQVPCTEQEAQQPSCRRVPCCWRRREAVPPECDRVPGAGRRTL